MIWPCLGSFLTQAVDAHVEAHVADLVELVQTLVRFDTTSVDLSPGSTHTTNQEADLQAYVGERLARSAPTSTSGSPTPSSSRTIR